MAAELYENIITNNQIQELLDAIGERESHIIVASSELRPIFLSYFMPFLETFNFDTSKIAIRYYNTNFPFSAHTDGLVTGKNDEIPVNHSVLVPLSWGPLDLSPHTLFFDQVDETPNHRRTGYKRKDIPIKHMSPGLKPKPINTDYSGLSNLTDEPFDVDLYNKWLSYANYDDLHGLTIHNVIKWSLGSVIKFESNRLHASADFVASRKMIRTHLLFKFYIPE